ncbi:MAG TPA: hypothetical protein VF169_21585 [Albitalea sp.]|uniref:hypothetical protein n=1 Tax=Piscinibacter sp. TaxID=1903157 RepID=UPI002ED2AB76
MPHTDVANYKFTVKEGAPSASGRDDAPVWIACEPYESELGILGQGRLSLDLAPGTTVDQAQEIARYLQRHVAAFRYSQG